MPEVSVFLSGDEAPLISAVFILHFVCTVFMTGVIWFVQVVHYPLFRAVAPVEFADYHRRHASRTAYVVIVPMVFELITAGILVALYPKALSNLFFLIACVLLVVIWLSTALLQAPSHHSLRREYSNYEIHRLVTFNWIRTLAWTLRTALLTLLFLQLFAPQ